MKAQGADWLTLTNAQTTSLTGFTICLGLKLVDSTVVRLEPKAEALLPRTAMPAFGQLVANGLAQRRKTLRDNLRNLLDASEIDASGIDPGCPGETLSPPERIALFRINAAKQRAQ